MVFTAISNCVFIHEVVSHFCLMLYIDREKFFTAMVYKTDVVFTAMSNCVIIPDVVFQFCLMLYIDREHVFTSLVYYECCALQ